MKSEWRWWRSVLNRWRSSGQLSTFLNTTLVTEVYLFLLLHFCVLLLRRLLSMPVLLLIFAFTSILIFGAAATPIEHSHGSVLDGSQCTSLSLEYLMFSLFISNVPSNPGLFA